jgi:hypothetical protein
VEWMSDIWSLVREESIGWRDHHMGKIMSVVEFVPLGILVEGVLFENGVTGTDNKRFLSIKGGFLKFLSWLSEWSSVWDECCRSSLALIAIEGRQVIDSLV